MPPAATAPVPVIRGFEPPPYPQDRLDQVHSVARQVPGGAVDLSIGTPCDAPPDDVIAALSASHAERGYPPSIGSAALRDAAAGWLARRLGAHIDAGAELAACIGTKEFVASTPNYLRLRRPDRDTVLYPAVSYPTYEMGALLAGCRAVAVPMDEHWCMRLDAVDPDDAARALCVWVNTPGNPAGGLDDLGAAAEWGRARSIPVLSDECYVEFTWDGPRRTILNHGSEGVLAVHSLSKRSNLAGVRAGFYAGDRDLVRYLREVRKHAGCMVPGPVQAAAAVAYADDRHVDAQCARYRTRLDTMAASLARVGLPVARPGGGFYLWVPVPGGDAWHCAHWLAEHAGLVTSPGEFYGRAASSYVRLAMVVPDDQTELVTDRLAAAPAYTPAERP